jgi:DinB family protein
MPEPGSRPAFVHSRLVEQLEHQADDVRRLTSGLDEEALSRQVVPGKWSLKELVAHLWRVQQVFEGRIESMLTQEAPAITPYEPEGDREFTALVALPGTQVVEGFRAAREQLLERLSDLSTAEWHRPGRHPEYPHYDLHFQVEYMAHHEAHHVYQLYQRRAPLGPVPH